MLATANSPASVELSIGSYVELCFAVVGQTLPADHGYGLYSAIAHLAPQVHEQDGLSILTIAGIPDRQGKIFLTERSHLRIRLPYESLPMVYHLAGKQLSIGSHSIRLGIPQIFMLRSADRLRARIVTIKNHQEPESFLEAARFQLDALGIVGKALVPLDAEGKPGRKTIKIKTYSVVGFGLEVSGLNADDSIKLQILGLGGKHRMGCGVFTPMQVF
ncbi:type I-MYXAN CRISPR-associated protein Cas6/Cmx6 [Thermosynechococcaceae cyanobacterium BACA0444]|uniref:Type I-MYXAN CRISPR-associated protein Cas6/Cmx6 n=1 Tax=Pseudocalidococcus azoricus BACA0444 TaxID=2918990 RepID=A0AAE4JZA1_9CYAN|nr:type I-MYXAN CRISPR-associated protein Cas6/Cmx6 [Pseudocalidococcus azoricus]MDS3860592.1 type I-MYXAN CRISPR-associated protein Cas6/Cmx6 [Pseudocalidococcus azoricus BACA0444]